MADDQYLLEDLEDEGEEVDYDDFNLEDEDFDEPATNGEETTANARDGEELNFDEPPPDFEDNALEGTETGTSDVAEPAKGAIAPEHEKGQSTETVEEKSKQPSTAGGRAPIPAPTFGRKQESSTASAKPKETEARGAAVSQRGRQGPRPGRGQQGRGPQGRGLHNGRQMPQPHSRGPTPPPGVPNGMGMPRPGPGLPGLPMPPGMLLPGQMMATRPMQMMPRPMPLASAHPAPPHGLGPAPALQSPDRQRGGRHAPIPAPPREPVRWQQPPGSRAQLQMGGPDHPRGPAGLPMPPNMTHMMFPGPRLPHPQPPPPASFGGRQDQRSPGASQPMPNGVRPRPLAPGGRGSANDFNLALGMDASAISRNPHHRGVPGGKPSVPQRLQGRLEDPAPLLGLLRPRDVAEELRLKEERQEAERAMARAKEAQEKKKAEELKAKRLEMAKLQIQLQAAENRRNQQLFAGAVAADERTRKQREAEDFEAMKLRVMQLEKLVAAAAAPGSTPASASKASASAPTIAAAPRAASVQPRKNEEAAGADAGLQVDFDDDDDDDDEDADARVAPQQPPRLPIAARLGSKDTKAAPAPHSKVVRPQVRMHQADRPTKEKRRPQRSSPAAEDMDADEAPGGPAGEGFTDLREFLSRKKRTREEGIADDSRPRAQAKAAAGHRSSSHHR